MSTTKAIEKKRKIIDLDEDTFRTLSIRAAAEGTNLKALIEKSLKELAEETKDAELYAYLVKNFPKGKEILNAAEKEEFENWLGI